MSGVQRNMGDMDWLSMSQVIPSLFILTADESCNHFGQQQQLWACVAIIWANFLGLYVCCMKLMNSKADVN